MNARMSPTQSSTRIDHVLTWARRTLLTGGFITAGCLMLAFVQVCLVSVERGESWRAEQSALVNPRMHVSQPASRP